MLARIGTATVSASRSGTELLAFLGEAFKSVLRLFVGKARFHRSDLFLILQEVGAQALPIVSLISFLVGVILAYVGALQLRQFGAQSYVADLVGVAMTREMGAMMAAIIMAGRTGAAFAAQLGTMQVNEEIDALATMGIPAMDFLVLPRMLALAVMMPLLGVYADLLGVLGGAIGGDAGKGAAIGAGVGALFGGFRRMRAMEEEQAQMASYQAQTGQATANFNRAYSACLQGRGYTVQ